MCVFLQNAASDLKKNTIHPRKHAAGMIKEGATADSPKALWTKLQLLLDATRIISLIHQEE